MAQLSVSERVRIARLSADSSRRAVVSRALGSPLLRWRYSAMSPGQLLIVPQDLRTADPSLWREIELGHFGLAGAVARTHGQSPFDVTAPSEAWRARCTASAGSAISPRSAPRRRARRPAASPATGWRAAPRLAWEPAVASRRLISWLSHAGLLLEGAESRSYDALMDSLGLQLRRLAGAWRDALAGQPRLLALTALVLADLCLAGHDRQLATLERTFGAEISRHSCRMAATSCATRPSSSSSPSTSCRSASVSRRGAGPYPRRWRALRRALPFLRTVRLGDGGSRQRDGRRFAGGSGNRAGLRRHARRAPADRFVSRYARLERGANRGARRRRRRRR